MSLSPPDDAERTVSRRQFVRAVTAGALTTTTLGGFSGRTRAAHDSHTPSHVQDPVYEESLLRNYQPRLLTQDLDVHPSAIHGFVVRSDRKQTTALCYWTEYPVQIGQTGYESHIGDHEPFYVYLANEDTPDEYVDRVVYSGYHWLAAEATDPPTAGGTDSDRPKAYVYPDYHHYSVGQARNDPRLGDDLPLKDLTMSLPRWLDDPDFHESLAEDWQGRGSPAFNPWLMLAKASWWRKEDLTAYEEVLRRAWLFAGIRGAEGADLDRGWLF
jgi:hypothetical protein